MKESDIIRSLFGQVPPPEDDCYFLAPNRLVTTDSLSEGTHFLHQWSSPNVLAGKLVEVNVSDITASGGVPKECFLNLGLSPTSRKKEWVLAFSKALRSSLHQYGMKLAGGDTFSSPTTQLTLTVVGTVKKPWLRSGGKPGDYLYVTGDLGQSLLGFHCLKKNWKDSQYKKAIQRHLLPKARQTLQKPLSQYPIHACMDVTDGLIQDAERLAIASKGKLKIQIESLPLHPLAKKVLGMDACLGSGEELELLFLSPKILPNEIHSIPVTRIGRMEIGKPGVQFIKDGKKYQPNDRGFLHFAEEE
ncbi:thiamine-phosphate kinase [Leptospira yanagawae serovar Saopaulo str. Sao Paulo = ATCC 700523]|uniref:Thiamine-monophosphate kinase n=2 Tax=Leptospira yanagawae TaxID=293069 RepID=A0ABY2M3C6_9LEPT|nr:thiamine-phosphate kinase [Leptospira yanagawae]EOQ90479.1 thiamine-phosphate kinase [Leptospira yanagawae serovar Saopaulo str. Sao Paulo = ATCC 700523]TGL19091.1 thiamine-phosphate kinase [Leptospira yanagawae]